MREIKVEEQGEEIIVKVKGIKYSMDLNEFAVDIPITANEADSLAFHLQSILQDREMRRPCKA